MTMPDAQPIPKPVRQQAARWFAQRETGELSADDEVRLAQWLAADPLHAHAFAQAEAVWEGLGGARIGAPPPPARRRARRFIGGQGAVRRRWAGGAIAASLALMLVFAADVPTRLQADAMTATGERREVRLPDGSIALLNTGSAIAFDEDGRTVRLLRGEAAFRVARDPDHPFSVIAGPGSTTALGTRFIVRRIEDTARVSVTEHSVRVSAHEQSAVLREGETLTYGPNGVGPTRSIAVPDADAWTRGRIRVVNRPLGEVVAELARYHRGYIAVTNAELAKRPVSGTFDIGDPVGAIGVIERTLGIASTRLTDHLILLHS
ncbi:transmembrane sensor [Sphingobium sp. OAS761]|uniref:FecR family protein n=1 Tax=Sphingobium sp. OAS761 TaxID=2817901 RepID=UPI00209D93FF|nr:FecR family protein [Sphingobium sp. OAS761]MCP1469674.1 transmembrane sensor [Sphingobium sp. OAS761]